GTRPSLVVTATGLDAAKADAMAAEGVAVITFPDNRWDRVDIKAIALLPNVLAKQAAREHGAREAWYVDRDGKVITRPAEFGILRGITRAVVLEAIRAQGLALEERPFTVAEALAAREAFLTSATQLVMPVVRIDGHPIGDGTPGPLATALRRGFHGYAAFT
ncbi:MAG: D-amino acid aminotransferase, partial [Alphaproteobacteria bacterium]|nr:D-amino acid aminotransferase [Alphaproteobacteria bacterium]